MRRVTKSIEKLGGQQQRFIALYRPTFTPWTQYELTEQPELAKECEERVVAAYKAGDAVEARMHFHRYRSIGVLPTTETWHKILLLAYNEGDYHDIQSLFHTLQSFGRHLDVNAWNFLLDILSKRGLVRKTEEIFWTIVSATKGNINEFTLRSLFNCYLQEKRYMRAMVAYAALQEFGYSIDDESLKILENFCFDHVQTNPGSMETLSVPPEDAPIVEAALKLDRVTFGHEHVLGCSERLSPAGRDAVLTWYSKRTSTPTPQSAFKSVLETARLAFEQNYASALGFDSLHLPILRGWANEGAFTVNGSDQASLDSHLARSPYCITSFTLEDGQARTVLLTKSGSEYQRQVLDASGNPVSSEEVAKVAAYLRSVKFLEFICSSL